MKRKFTIFIIIITLLLGIAGLWYSQKNIYSKEVLKLEILGPEEVKLAEEVEYLVKFKNNGDIRLDNPILTFEFPAYSVREDGEPLRQEIRSEELGGAIYPGNEKTLKFKARLFGKEGEAKEIKVWLKYQPKNLNAWYESATTFNTIIEKVPLNFTFDLPSKVEPDKEVQFRLNYFSNTDFPLADLRIEIDYPSGFEFISSNPRALEEKEWEIGLLNKAEGGRIEISGNLKGEIGEQKIFKARLGSWQNGEFVLLKEVFKGVEIMKPSLYIIQEINGNPEYIASPGDTLHYEIFFKNLGQESLNDIFFLVQLEGEPFDLDTVRAPTGDFESGDSSIFFDWRKNYQLRLLNPQEEEKIDFWVELKEDWGASENPIIKNKVTISQVREEFENKVNSKLEISQRGFFEDEVFGNSGPIPPEVGEETTYTIMWNVKNYYNQINNAKVKATLPSQVELTGKIFPEDQSQNFVFDSISREIVWDIGDLEEGIGVFIDSPNIAFQVSLTPTINQKGNPALLIGESRILGEDQWTEQIIETSDEIIDTTLPDDSTISEEQGMIQ